jgi:carbamoyl-phosphate synthase large subunit
MRGALAAAMGIEALIKKGLAIRALQEYHRT